MLGKISVNIKRNRCQRVEEIFPEINLCVMFQQCMSIFRRACKMSYRVFVLQTLKKHCLKSLYNAKYADEKNPLNYAFCDAKMHELNEHLNALNQIQLGASPRQQMAYAQQMMEDEQQMAQQALWVQQQQERASQSEWVQQQQKLAWVEEQAEWDRAQQQAWAEQQTQEAVWAEQQAVWDRAQQQTQEAQSQQGSGSASLPARYTGICVAL